MTVVLLSDLDPLTAAVDALVVGVYTAGGDDPTGGGPVPVDPAHVAIVAAAALAGATGKAGSVTTVPGAGLVSAQRAIVVGLGASPAQDATADPLDAVTRPSPAERIRRAAGAASRAAAGLDEIVSTLAALDLTAAAEGHLLGAYAFTTYTGPGKAPVGTVLLVGAGGDDRAAGSLGRPPRPAPWRWPATWSTPRPTT